ncbi:MAG: ribonuclease HII [Candidatus Pacebacteria bacterium]|nr:ribonuclease HII [Candidatus Paceibacterota bacterium]
MRKREASFVFGIDEVGRGPLAGPVVAVALTAPVDYRVSSINYEIRDSKKMSFQQREEIFAILKKHPRVWWGIGRVSERVIDKINIFESTKLAMIRAVKGLEKKTKRQAQQLLIDGNFGIALVRPQQSIIKGDETVYLIKLASIVAKVHRDRLMMRYHQKYPQYGFNQHKGYGTKLHIEMIKRYGPCAIHRRSFAPISRDFL